MSDKLKATVNVVVTQGPSRWIPVEERLPGDVDWVLVVAVSPADGSRKVDIGIVEGDGWCAWLGRVTHWMPLPLLPGEASDGADY